ncbi:tRNA preQ1(34) S-adenosylmethionine ribosyltransferase-isomerase QueA [Helicobacter sp. 12S02232-10]|uniref:tRNA preQ1(34) S-adenosylmethionine ribosyltransferase-isomerase QueA n=1 Tax=Helicobacter sp. 12S02232-10 TaxID=1476197 RepID=UPI000BA50297|nr:tRNA preQ1(34) S-adenosylmethionine ribosyltransferase-isomerase QueA [Helicobacter sp. 12S02232-10]PAF48722.1 tRNA preQ1(34) S-adenosylmethionine ribosyltransferase-isomerase QueA [Helicobacter sp. 12S02232-10]
MENDFVLQSYDYALPKELIATYPASPKESAKLLVYDRKRDKVTHSDFYHIFDFIPKEALIVLNDTKVIKARIYGHKESGGGIEILFHCQSFENRFLVQIKGRIKEGSKIILEEGYECIVEEMFDEGYRGVAFFREGKRLDLGQTLDMLEKFGHVPIPPYIKRTDEELDLVEYQSVFAKNYGSIAAPTASLHFSLSSMERLKKDFSYCFLTLHIGAGTFAGVEAADIREHKIHTESLLIPVQAMEKIDQANEILCVGTTALRSIEYYKRLKNVDRKNDLHTECDIFLHPGNPVLYANHLLTNFHLPKSSLIMLVASMTGLKKCRELYEIAIKKSYRFYSYGDGMLIL